MEEIVNKVAQSGLITFNLEEYFDTTDVVEFDMKDHLFQGLILKERDFRTFIKENDWNQYEGKHVALFCTADAIVPTWAYMLVANKLSGIASEVFFGSKDALQQNIIQKRLEAINVDEFTDKRVVIKGCSNYDVPIGAYVEITNLLSPVVKSIMFGEPCSTVPIYKKKLR